MAGTDITNLLEIIQRKIDAADGNTATKDLLYLLSAVRKGDGTALELYDSSGAFPDLTDSDADKEMIAYKLDSDRLYFNVGVWKGKSLPAGGGGPTYTFQGSNFGYASGGLVAPSSFINVIDKFPFSSDANASDVGDLNIGRTWIAGQSSTENGYSSGGRTAAVTSANDIEKFAFSVDANATDVGDLSVGRYAVAGQSSSDNGYTSGGSVYDIIDKFPFAADANATDVGNLTLSRRWPGGQSSDINGYSSGGNYPGAPHPSTINRNEIDKFPFASDANATDVGDLTLARFGSAGQSSTTHGYTSGGNPNLNTIDKFPFASDTNASDVGDLTTGRYRLAGQSSTENGYSSSSIIDKFPFASDANATDVGNLTVARIGAAGQQY